MSVNNIENSLNTLSDLYVDLINLAKEKREVLINNNVSRLSILISMESDLVKRIVEVDTERIKHVQTYCLTLGITPEESTSMKDLLRYINNPQDKKSLSAVQHRLLTLTHELGELNALNTDLIKQSLTHIDYSLNVITGNVEQDITYKKPHVRGYQNDVVGSRFNSSI